MNAEAPTNTLVETERYWYYLENDKQNGPISENLITKMLNENVLGPDTLVWSEPMTEWIRASEIESFKSSFIDSPPPIPQISIKTNPESTTIEMKDNVSQVRPWVRFWARLCDIYLFSIPFGVVFGIVYPPLLYLPEIVLGMLILLSWVFVEAWLLSTWGTTPGKCLLKTTVRYSSGRKLKFSEALNRSFLVWVKGFGLGFPIIYLITLIVAHTRLKREGSTSWDQEVSSMVIHERINELRTVTMAFLLLSFFLLIIWASV